MSLGKPQLQLWDMRDSRGEPVFEAPGLVRLEPLSVRELVDNLGQDADPLAPLGSQDSGCQREKMAAEVLECLGLAFHAAQQLYGDQVAAAVLLHICAHDQSFEPPAWLRDVWAEYRDELRELFHGHGDDGRTDWAARKNDDDEEEGEDDGM